MGKCCCLVFVLVVALLVLGLSVGIPLGIKNAKQTVKTVSDNAVNTACQATSYPATCNQTFAGTNGYASDSAGVTKFSVQSAAGGVNSTLESVLALNGTNPNITAAVEVCVETLGLSMEQLDAAVGALNSSDSTTRQKELDDIKTWVSAAMELHTTCVDAFLEVSAADGKALQEKSAHTDELLSNALAFINALAYYGDNLLAWKPTGFSLPDGISLSDLSKIPLPKIPGLGHRRLLASQASSSEWIGSAEGVPNWIAADAQVQRHLLQASTTHDVVVATDGTGNFKTIQEAVNASPQNGKNNTAARYVIYIKAGIYNEQVIIPTSATNLMFIGDGANQTIITGSRSVALTPKMTTFKSATLIVQGNGFIGRSFKVENTAGSGGHQAVAVRVTADKVAFYQCTIDGWQDTLYAHTFRQYYRECTISGTVDFIFGNSAAVFQACNIVAKRTTLLGQQNTYTAQGRTDPHQNTGVSFQNCTFDGVPELKSNTSVYKTYLGRPWKAYSVCVLLKSDLMDHIDPSGWLPWNTSTFGLATSFFAEYQNVGPGSNTTQRVSWSHQITDTNTASKYQASNFVQATAWLPSYNIPTTLTL